VRSLLALVSLPGGLCPRALPRHLALEPIEVESYAALVRDVLREIEGKAEGVVEAEQLATGQRGRRAAEARDRPVEDLDPRRDRLREALLLAARHLVDRPGRGEKLGIDAGERRQDRRRDLVEERLADAELQPVPDRPPQDPPQDVPALVVRGHHAVGHEDAQRPGVIGDHAQREVRLAPAAVAHARPLRGGFEDRDEQVGLVVAALARQHGGHPLEPHARIYARAGSGGHVPSSRWSNCMNTRFQISTKRRSSVAGVDSPRPT